MSDITEKHLDGFISLPELINRRIAAFVKRNNREPATILLSREAYAILCADLSASINKRVIPKVYNGCFIEKLGGNGIKMVLQ